MNPGEDRETFIKHFKKCCKAEFKKIEAEDIIEIEYFTNIAAVDQQAADELYSKLQEYFLKGAYRMYHCDLFNGEASFEDYCHRLDQVYKNAFDQEVQNRLEAAQRIEEGIGKSTSTLLQGI